MDESRIFQALCFPMTKAQAYRTYIRSASRVLPSDGKFLTHCLNKWSSMVVRCDDIIAVVTYRNFLNGNRKITKLCYFRCCWSMCGQLWIIRHRNFATDGLLNNRSVLNQMSRICRSLHRLIGKIARVDNGQFETGQFALEKAEISAQSYAHVAFS